MTREILVINPTRKKSSKKTTVKKRKRRKTTEKRSSTMAKRKRRSPRRNPAPKRRPSRTRRARKIVRRASKTFSALEIKNALKDAPPALIGMFGAKFAAKLGASGAMEADPTSWTWRSYLQGAAGAIGSAFLLGSVRAKWGKEALKGGINLMLYELVQNELVASSPTAMNWLGQEDIEPYEPTEYMGDYGEDEYDEDEYVPGNVYPNSVGEPYLLGQDGNWYPIDETNRLPESTSSYVSDDLVTPGPLGDQLVPVSDLGKSDDWDRAFLEGEDPYKQAFF
jgi:hypothetical protein